MEEIKPVALAFLKRAASYTSLSEWEVDEISQGTNVLEGMSELAVAEAYAQECISRTTREPRFEELAVACIVLYIHSKVPARFSQAMEQIWQTTGILEPEVYKWISQHTTELDAALLWRNDFRYTYRGIVTLMKNYLIISQDGTPMERPNHMLMRVACGNGYRGMSMPEILDVYRGLSNLEISVATPVMYNSGTKSGAAISCYLLPMKDDSINGIYETLHECAQLARGGGGIGLSIQNIRPRGSLIRSVNRESSGIVPMLKPFETTMSYVDQGKRRKGSTAIYLTPWHMDIQEWLQLRTNHKDTDTVTENDKCRGLFYGIWGQRLFFEQVLSGGDWNLFCSDSCPELYNSHGDRFEELYYRYAREGRKHRVVSARDLYARIMQTLCETGMPYLHNGCLLNYTSNQRNLGTIRSSNLCAEIVEYNGPDETACCVLGSISLTRAIRRDSEGRPLTHDPQTGLPLKALDRLDLGRIMNMVATLVRLLNCLIDNGKYVNENTRRSNMRHRPLGIGVQGFANMLQELDLSFEDPEVKRINIAIFETMYYAAVRESIRQAQRYGPYPTWPGCPARQGRLHFDLHREYLERYHRKWLEPMGITEMVTHTRRDWFCENPLPEGIPENTNTNGLLYDWDLIRADLDQWGMRNSLLLALMPTQSTALIMGNYESTYVPASNMYVHSTLSGKFMTVNTNMVRDLQKESLWTPEIRERIIAAEGSVQQIPEIPERLRRKYKTAFEIDQKYLIDLAAERQPFICQSQSFDMNVIDPTPRKMTNLTLYSYKRGNGTIIYYARSNPATEGLKFVIDAKLDMASRADRNNKEQIQDSLDSCSGGACKL